MQIFTKKLIANILAGLIVYGIGALIILLIVGDSIQNNVGFIIFWAVFMTTAELTIFKSIRNYFNHRKTKKVE